MTVPLEYVDTVTLVDTVIDAYGEKAGERKEVTALFLQNTGFSHSGNVDAIDGDATLYLDPEDEFVLSRAFRLEGLYVIANPFGFDDSESWYKIVNVNVGQDKLLTNSIDNILTTLKKSTELPSVS